MTQHRQRQDELQRLATEIPRDEQALRERFLDVPPMPPATLAALKHRLRAEVHAIQASQSSTRPGLRFLAATAATLLLALGLRFAAIDGTAGGTSGPGADRTTGINLEAFADSLNDVLSGEDEELQGLYGQLRELEMQAAGGTANPSTPEEPAALRGLERTWSEG